VIWVAQTIYSRAIAKEVALGKREQLLVLEMDRDVIDSASSFVDYISDEYGISKSSVWYNLNCLKEKGVVSFADRLHQGEPLMLSKKGVEQL
jgi:biotin operon repressor